MLEIIVFSNKELKKIFLNVQINNLVNYRTVFNKKLIDVLIVNLKKQNKL